MSPKSYWAMFCSAVLQAVVKQPEWERQDEISRVAGLDRSLHRLAISDHTVQGHLAKTYSKLNAATIHETD